MEAKEVAAELRKLADKFEKSTEMWTWEDHIGYEHTHVLKFTYPSGRYKGQSYHFLQLSNPRQDVRIKEIVKHLNASRFVPSAVVNDL